MAVSVRRVVISIIIEVTLEPLIGWMNGMQWNGFVLRRLGDYLASKCTSVLISFRRWFTSMAGWRGRSNMVVDLWRNLATSFLLIYAKVVILNNLHLT